MLTTRTPAREEASQSKGSGREEASRSKSGGSKGAKKSKGKKGRGESAQAAGGNLATLASNRKEPEGTGGGDDGRREGEGQGEGQGGSAPMKLVHYPTADRMRGLASVLAMCIPEWETTRNETTTTQRRERGFWIKWNKKTDTFSKTSTVTSPWKANKENVAVELGTRPADDGDVCVVASFHTHTPTVHRAPEDMKDGARRGGPSQSDFDYDDKDDVAGLVFDYAAPIVKAGHPLNAHAVVYKAGERRWL